MSSLRQDDTCASLLSYICSVTLTAKRWGHLSSSSLSSSSLWGSHRVYQDSLWKTVVQESKSLMADPTIQRAMHPIYSGTRQDVTFLHDSFIDFGRKMAWPHKKFTHTRSSFKIYCQFKFPSNIPKTTNSRSSLWLRIEAQSRSWQRPSSFVLPCCPILCLLPSALQPCVLLQAGFLPSSSSPSQPAAFSPESAETVDQGNFSSQLL